MISMKIDIQEILLDKEKDKTFVTILLVIASGVAGFILLNELIETITGSAIIG